MSRNEIFENIKEVFDDFFDGDVEITEDSSMDNVSEWDSVAHIQLMFELEGAFGITIKSEEISELVTVQKMMDAVERKLKN